MKMACGRREDCEVQVSLAQKLDSDRCISSAKRAAVESAFSLPPIPHLDECFLRHETAHAPNGLPLEALVPANAEHTCDDPNAPAFVMVPGLGMDGWGFFRQLPLGAISNLHLFQMPNAPAPEEQGLGHFARHVEDYIVARGLDKRPGGVIVGGCSMGGAVSLHIATRQRIKLRGLALIGTFADCKHLAFWKRWAAPLSWILPLHRSRFIARHVVKKTRYFGALAPAEADFLCNWKVERNQNYFGRAVMALTRQKQLDAAAKLKTPAYITHGKQDYILPFAAGEELAKAIPNSRWHPMDDAGHAIFFTHAEAMNTALAKFISETRVGE